MSCGNPRISDCDFVASLLGIAKVECFLLREELLPVSAFAASSTSEPSSRSIGSSTSTPSSRAEGSLTSAHLSGSENESVRWQGKISGSTPACSDAGL